MIQRQGSLVPVFSRNSTPLALFGLLASTLTPPLAQAQGPVFEISQEGSAVQFSVKASVAIAGKFDK
jgi:hypothetical protein